jgi:hypothetical protein
MHFEVLSSAGLDDDLPSTIGVVEPSDISEDHDNKEKNKDMKGVPNNVEVEHHEWCSWARGKRLNICSQYSCAINQNLRQLMSCCVMLLLLLLLCGASGFVSLTFEYHKSETKQAIN